MSKRGKEEGKGPQQTPAWQAPGFPPSSQAPWALVGTGICNLLGPCQMHTTWSTPIKLIRAMFSALLAARQLLAVPSPSLGEVTAF